MLAQALTQLLNDRLTSVKEISEITGAASSTVYRWANGETQPHFEEVRLLIHGLSGPAAQRAILLALMGDTSWQFHYAGESDLDSDHNGVVDLEDALDAAIKSVQAASESLSRIRSVEKAPRLTPEACLQLTALLQDVVQQCAVSQGVLARLAKADAARKQARPLRES